MSDDIEAGVELVRKIRIKVDDLLAPLAREMRIMKWSADYRAILWEAVMLEAKARLETCERS